MARLTRKKDRYECRIDTCVLEDWFLDHVIGRNIELVGSLCDNCPVMPYINKLAKYEDMSDEAQKIAQKIIQEHFPNIDLSLDESEE